MSQDKIKSVMAREIYNGRGFPSVEAEVITNKGHRGLASSPSGISLSSHEAIEIRDGGARLMGKGVLTAVKNIQECIAPQLIGMDITDQREIDKKMGELDGTPNKSNLGANALVAVSLAVAKAASSSLGLQPYQYIGGIKASALPVICPNMLSGSKTAGNNLDFEDYLIVPFGFTRIDAAIRAGVEVFHVLHQMLVDQFGLIPQVTALAPPLQSTREALDVIQSAIEKLGYEGEIGLGIDATAQSLYDKRTGTYRLREGNFSTKQLIDYYVDLAKDYPIIFLEDGLREDDFEGFADLTRQLNCLVVGDDLFGTNRDRVIRGAKHHAANAVLFKVNQAGTLSESLRTAETAKNYEYKIVSSVRSGETEDTIQVDLAMAVGAKLMKVGAPIRGEMITKYNRFLKIAEELGECATFRGQEFSLQ